MSLDRWLDEGFGGEARRQYEDRLSMGRQSHLERTHTAEQLAELERVDRETRELRQRLGLTPARKDTRFDELIAWVLGPRPEEK